MVNQRSETNYASFDDACARATADDQCAVQGSAAGATDISADDQCAVQGSAAGANDISTGHSEESSSTSFTNQGRGGVAARDEPLK